jgi:hypothetical protein
MGTCSIYGTVIDSIGDALMQSQVKDSLISRLLYMS